MLIPKIVHRIWLTEYGGLPKPPKIFENWWDDWKRLYPDWEFKTWDGTEFEIPYREWFDASPCFAWKTDMYRYMLMDKFGGLYIDTDIEPYRNMEHLIEHFDCFFIKQNYGRVTNAMFGSVPGHRIWNYFLEKMAEKPPSYYHSRLGGMNVDQAPAMIGPIFINPFVQTANDVTILSGTQLMSSGKHNATDLPDAYNCHHLSNTWRSAHAYAAYKKLIEAQTEFDKVDACTWAECVNRGEHLHRMHVCTSCAMPTKIKAYPCKIHRTCTIGRKVDGVHICKGCPDFTPFVG